MICSECKKNTAIIFINSIDKDGKDSLKGLCYDCAKKKGIDPLDVIAKQNNILNNNINNNNNVSNQIESLFKDLSKNLNLESLNLVNLGNDPTNSDDDDSADKNMNGMPLESLFAGFITPNNDSNDSENINTKQQRKTSKNKKKKRKFLDSYGTNLTQKAKNNELDNVIGRNKEIERMIQILNRRSKNNPCLIGEPGVGKTALAQGLAIKIANKEVPPKLLDKEVYLIDMTALIAGTQFRGQFEARIKSLVDECKDLGNIILVIDEIHNIIGAGDADHSMNAANILKPSLANGEIQLIGTTTLKEYRKYIEKDSALERRFQPIIVQEPNIQDTVEILEGIKQYYEKFHGVKISKEVIEKTVSMSEKYIHDRFLPDKAIDILDEACSRINLNNQDLFKLQVLKKRLQEVKDEQEEIAAESAKATNENDSNQDYEKAAKLKATECSIAQEIDDIQKNITVPNLTVQDIAQVIESWTKIPVTKITEAETDKLLNLEKNLHTRIIGQNEAVNSVARAIRRNRAGLKSTKRPPSFIFVGPTGVGKTELAKSLAYEMFGNEDMIIRIDMSEYMESNSTSKLIGSPQDMLVMMMLVN